MMLEYGLDAPAAGATLAGAVSAVLVDGPQTPDLLRRGVGATSREFTSRSSPASSSRSPGRAARMKMNGADAILRSLEAEGVDVMFGLPGGAILPLYDAMARGTTVRHVLARHEQGAGHMAEGYARASGTRRRRHRDLRARRDEPRHADRRRLDGLDAARLHHGTGALVPDRHRRVPGVRHHRHHDPDRQAFVARSGRRRAAARLKAAFHVARTGRCGPVLVDVPRDVQEAELDFSYPDSITLPGWKPPRRGHARQIAAAAAAVAAAERPILYVGGGALNAHATDELLRARGVGAPARRHDADGEERVPRVARAPRRLARHARAEVVELGAEQGRPDRRGRRALRRPRHRQGLRVRARRDGRAPRHRCRRDLEDPPRRHPRGRAAEARARAALEGARRAEGRVAYRALAPADRRVARAVPASLSRATATC